MLNKKFFSVLLFVIKVSHSFQLNQVVFIYLCFISLEKRFHLSTVVSVDELSAELVFDREAREEWETNAAWSSSSFNQNSYRIDPTNATEQLDLYTRDKWETSTAWKQSCRKELCVFPRIQCEKEVLSTFWYIKQLSTGYCHNVQRSKKKGIQSKWLNVTRPPDSFEWKALYVLYCTLPIPEWHPCRQHW